MPDSSLPAAARGWVSALVAATISGGLLALAFPNFGLDWLAWFALAPLFILVARAPSPWRALWPGWLAGAVFFALSCPWIAATVHNYGDVSPALAGVVMLLFCALMGAYFALFAAAGFWLGRFIGHRLLPLPLLWIAVEWLRTYTPMGGFPWNLLGYAQTQHPGFMLVVPLAGIYGASFLIAGVNTLITALALRDHHAVACGVALAAILAYATFPYHPPALPLRPLRATLVQPNAPLNAAWSGASLQAFLKHQEHLSLQGSAPTDLILWPEQPAPLNYNLEPEFQTVTAEMLSQSHAGFLFDEVTYPLTPTGAPDYNAPRNSSQFIRPDGTTGPRYDKMHLVPFGEYVPLPAWLQRALGAGKLLQNVGNFVPGDHPQLFTLDGRPFGTLICYESIFPALARNEVRDGAQWLVNQSDDSWYGTSSAAAQGLMMAQVRAIENRRWLLRDTNDGLTAVIDPYGRITAQLPRFTATSLEAGFTPESDTTFYTRHGDWFPLACCLALAACAALRFRRRWVERDPT